MSEILNSIRLKDKLTIAGAMAAVAAVLAIVVGLVTHLTADRHTHVYDYSLEIREGHFNLTGVCTVDNCEDPFFREDNVQGVELVSSVSPTCAKEGNRVYSYVHGGYTITFTERLPKAPHTYDYELVSNGDNLHINGKCSVEGCPEPYIFIPDAQDLTLIEVEEATCFTPRKETYAFISDGETKTFVTLVKVDVPHTLLGLPANSFQSADKTFPYGSEGIKMLGDADFGCGETGQGYYVCEVCRQAVGVNVRRPEHKYAYDESSLVKPTVDATGSVRVKCQNEWCDGVLDVALPKVQKGVNAFTKTEATEVKREVLAYSFKAEQYNLDIRIDVEIGELLTHEYSYSLKPDEVNNKEINLIGICTQPGCQTPELVVKNVETTFVDTSTCTEKGYWIWTHVLEDGEEVVLKVRSIAYAPHDYTFDPNRDVVKPTEYRDGSATLTCKNNGCSHTTTVELPKVVIGENATVQQQFTNGLLVNYVYTTEEGYKIELLILVDR